MTDAELKAVLNRGGISEQLYEGEIGETNMAIWHKLAEAFKDYYDFHEYNARREQSEHLRPQ